MPPGDNGSRLRNRLLLTLPPGDLALLRPSLVAVELPHKHTLVAPGEPIEAAWFVEAGAVSLLAEMEDGSLVEVGIVGREGMVGMPLVLGARTFSTRAYVEMPGSALRLSATALRTAQEASPTLRTLLLRYALAFHSQVSRTAACNARHVIEERLARWLLIAHDQADGNELVLTQEVLSQMLGVRRQGVTQAAGILQRAGLIRLGRGSVTILDRAGLEAAACECYGETRREFEALLSGGDPPDQSPGLPP